MLFSLTLLVPIFFHRLLCNICLLACLLAHFHPSICAACTKRTHWCTRLAVGRVSAAMFVASVTLYYMLGVHICIFICTVRNTISNSSRQASKFVQSDESTLFSSFHISLSLYKVATQLYRHIFTTPNANQTGKILLFKQQTQQQQQLNANCNWRTKKAALVNFAFVCSVSF